MVMAIMIILIVICIVLISWLIEGGIFMFLANLALALFGVDFALTYAQSIVICIILTFIGGFFKSVNHSRKE